MDDGQNYGGVGLDDTKKKKVTRAYGDRHRDRADDRDAADVGDTKG